MVQDQTQARGCCCLLSGWAKLANQELCQGKSAAIEGPMVAKLLKCQTLKVTFGMSLLDAHCGCGLCTYLGKSVTLHLPFCLPMLC